MVYNISEDKDITNNGTGKADKPEKGNKMKINKTNIAKYAKKPTTDVMDCGYYAFAIDGDEMYLGDYHLNSNSWSQWREQHQAYVNIYDNGRCKITVGDNEPFDVWYDGNVADWREKILTALQNINQ